ERVVLEISHDVEPDEAVIGSLNELSQSGYSIALDDFDFSEQKRPMLDVANYVKLDFERFSREEISKQFSILKQTKAKAVAKGIETHDDFEAAKAIGFEYFRGSCFNKPKLATPTRVPINRLSTLQLVLKLQEPELSTQELEKIVSQDLAISYKL